MMLANTHIVFRGRDGDGRVREIFIKTVPKKGVDAHCSTRRGYAG